MLRMVQRKHLGAQKIPTIHKGKTPVRKHYIVERAEKLGLKQTDLIEGTGADKGTVSRWFRGVLPTDEYIEKVAVALECEDVRELFQDPDDDWLARRFRAYSQDEKERAQRILDDAFPKANRAS
jgi:transcriptional regulator with XRE-family HTH domain